MPVDIQVELSHATPDVEGRQVIFMRARKDDDPKPHASKRVNVSVLVQDGRGCDLKLDDASFELFNHPTALSTKDFYGGIKVSSEYYAEIKALLTKVTGSPHVHVFHHQVRNAQKAELKIDKDGSCDTSTPVQPYASNAIHTDSSQAHAESMFASIAHSMPAECQSGRFLYINAWRSITDEPIEDNHLAVLDESTVVKPDDFIANKLHGVGYDVLQYTLSARNARQHRWYYFPKMVKDEVILFKQWDSDPLLSGRTCFHTAIKDPTARVDAPSRQSIEVRAFVFFPDHQPNTCPPRAAPAVVGCDESMATAGAVAIQGAVRYCQGNATIRMLVLQYLAGAYQSGGAKAVLAEFAEDRQGHHGLTDASKETKARVVELSLAAGAGAEVDQLFSGPSAVQILMGKVVQSRATAALIGLATGIAVSALRRR